MAGNVKFEDFSFKVKAEINETSIGWLYAWSEEIKSHAQRNCKTEYSEGSKDLKGSYAVNVNEATGEALIGSPLEAAYWEEWGTGEHAAHGDGRKGWWIYCPDQPSMGGGHTYHDEMEAMMMAAYIQQTYGKKAYATNGRKPNYTLEKAFKANDNKARADLQRLLKEMGT